MFWPAIFRFREYAPIEKTYYDCDKHEIKAIRFPAVYAPVADYIIKHEHMLQDRYEFMFERMAKHRKLMAIAFVNSAYYMSMYCDHVEGCNLEGGDLIAAPGYYDYCAMLNKELIPVGFERTYCPALSSLITPGRIFYDQEIRKIYYKGEWIFVPGGIVPQPFKGKSLYKELLKTKNKDGIVYTGTEAHIYLK